MVECDRENAAGGRDEGDFADGGGEGLEELLCVLSAEHVWSGL